MAKTSIKNREEIKALREQGMTYQAIADMYGVSKQCIEQLIHREKYYERRNTEEYKQYTKEYRKKNFARDSELQKKWREKHPNYMKAYYRTHKKDKNSIDK